MARDIARVLGARHKSKGSIQGNDLIISWCFGHMLELHQPGHYSPEWKRWTFDNMPMIPDQFALNVRDGVKDHWKILKGLLSDKNLTDVVNACDAGREGELIFQYVYQAAKCKAPVKRLWISSLTDASINSGWNNLQDGEKYRHLADAARCRSEADWIVGLNSTRAMTCLARSNGGDQLLSVGRVQTPTLAMIVARDREITDFKPEAFWQVDSTFSVATAQDSDNQAPKWTGRWFDPTRKTKKGKDKEDSDKSERLSSKADAEAIVSAATGQAGFISSISKNAKKEAPPLLYDLTALQRRANQRYGLSAQNTLDIAQALYEKHKLLTYPRTDARYLTPDQIPTLTPILNGIAAVSVYKPFVDEILAAPLRTGKRIVNAKEVGDHHAIIPTGRSPISCNLSPDEKRIFDLVARRLMAALSLEAIFDLTECIVSVETNAELPETLSSPLLFRSKGRICRQIGWQAVDPPGKKHKDKELPNLEEGTATNTDSCDLKEGMTRAPKHHNDASILRAMETAGATLDDKELKRAMRRGGLGTPATRAAIIQTLLRREFIERKGKDLCALPRGTSLISAVPVDELKSAKLTGRWEARLSKIADGQEQRDVFMADVGARIERIVNSIKSAEPPPPEKIAREQGEELGKCPICEEPVRDRKVVYACDTGRSCSFVIFSSIAKRKISKSAVKKMLKGETTATLKGFKSKKGSEFSAAMKLDEEGKVKFVFEERGARDNRSKNDGRGKGATDPTGSPCPKCKTGRLIRGRTAIGCSRWREGCDHRQPLNN